MPARKQSSRPVRRRKSRGGLTLVDLSEVRTYPIRRRANKVKLSDMASPLSGAGARRFIGSFPDQLKATDLRRFVSLTIAARRKNLPFHWMMGAHVIKTGLSPVVIDLMKRGLISGVSFNGAGVIHDLELAFWGGTSENVSAGLADGSFGMARETGEAFAAALEYAYDHGYGLGEGVGHYIRKKKAPNARISILAECARLGLPATIHVSIGSDIVAQHPAFSGSLTGELSHKDFCALAGILRDADRGGIVMNVGSASVLPEVFLKALTVARNLDNKRGAVRGKVITANFDMIQSYRPTTNVVTRPTEKTGHGFEFIGHHEIMIPLLAWALKSHWKK